MFNNMTGWHLIAVLIVVILLFGAPKLPGLAKSLGQSMKIFRSEVRDLRADDDAPKADRATTTVDGSSTSAARDASTAVRHDASATGVPRDDRAK